jgi:hypothetical protein
MVALSPYYFRFLYFRFSRCHMSRLAAILVTQPAFPVSSRSIRTMGLRAPYGSTG